MARPRKKGSTNTYGGMGMKPEEDEKLVKMLEDKGITLKQLQRALVRQWMSEDGPGMLSYKSSPTFRKY